jgi:hypothetical protein
VYNETLLLDAPAVRGPVSPADRDRTADLARIIRHSLKSGAASTPLDRAIRSAARVTDPEPLASADADDRARFLARRLNVLLARRSAPSADPHRDTVTT